MTLFISSRKCCGRLLGLFGLALWCLQGVSGCSGNPSSSDTRRGLARGKRLILHGATMLDGTNVSIEVRGHTITKVGEVNAPGVDVSGMWLVPAFIDSHVHLDLLPAVAELTRAGVAGVVDLASPRVENRSAAGRLFMKSSGPMITTIRGYPTQSWGQGGYGREVGSKQAALAAVDALVKQGADLIAIPLGPTGVSQDWAEAIVERAHKRHKVQVVAHTVGSEEAAFAADAGVDALAHMPIDSMDQETLDIMSEGAVITTLAQLGGSPGAIRNLRELREREGIILYGTNLGNSKITGIPWISFRSFACISTKRPTRSFLS